jgi:hypothetical protein
MDQKRDDYPSAQALAQDASTKYDFPVKDLLPAAKEIFSAKNPLFPRRTKRKIRQGARHLIRTGVMKMFGMKPRSIRFASGPEKKPVASAHRSTQLSSISSQAHDELMETLKGQGYSKSTAEGLIKKHARAGDSAEMIFDRIFKKNPEEVAGIRLQLAPADRRSFNRAAEFFRGFHGSDPKRVIRHQATIIESGDYSLLGRLYGYDLSDRDIHPFRDVTPNFQVKDTNPIMLCGGTIERVPVDELRSVPSWVIPDDQGKVLVAHQLMVIGGDQNLEPVLESQFGVTSTADLVILGEISNIWYIAKKSQNRYKVTHYHHTFGEEEETPSQKREARPWLMYDRRHQKQFIVGGAYSVPVEGIRN